MSADRFVLLLQHMIRVLALRTDDAFVHALGTRACRDLELLPEPLPEEKHKPRAAHVEAVPEQLLQRLLTLEETVKKQDTQV